MVDPYQQLRDLVIEGRTKGHFEKPLHGKDELEGLADVYFTTIGEFTRDKHEEFGKAAIKLNELIPKMQSNIYNTCVAAVISTKDYTFWPTEENMANLRMVEQGTTIKFSASFIQKKHLLAEKYKDDVREVQLSEI